MNRATVTPAQTDAQAGGDLSRQFANAFAEPLRQAVSAQTQTAWASRILPGTPQAQADSQASPTTVLRLTGSLTGELTLTLRSTDSAPLLAALQSASPSLDLAEAWLTLCTAAGEILIESPAPSLAALGIASCQLAAPNGQTQTLAQIELSTPGGAPGALVTLSADPVLLASLAKLEANSRVQPNAPDEPQAEPGAQIGRVIDVPLAVTLRFGQRHLTLREVLALTTGSLVELDRQVEEPVDLVLGDRLIARGEVVIVDGNYGLRVTEVVEGAAGRIRRLQAGHAAPETQTPEKALA